LFPPLLKLHPNSVPGDCPCIVTATGPQFVPGLTPLFFDRGDNLFPTDYPKCLPSDFEPLLDCVASSSGGPGFSNSEIAQSGISTNTTNCGKLSEEPDLSWAGTSARYMWSLDTYFCHRVI
jgi:hypothetical protein